MAIRNVAVLVLYDDQGQILLQHRTKDAKRLPDHWAFFGGGIEGGETPEAALRREIIEELEYKVVVPKLIFEQQFEWEDDQNVKYVFVEKYDPTQPLNLHEGQGMRWFDFASLGNLLIADHDRIALEKIKIYVDSVSG